MSRVNVIIFKRFAEDTWHKGICVNAESQYATIVDTKGNVYRGIYDVKDYCDEGSFYYKTTNGDINSIKEENQTIKIE